MAASLIGANITIAIPQKILALISGALMLSLLFFIPRIEGETEIFFPVKFIRRLLDPILHTRLQLTHNWRQVILLHLAIFLIALYGGFFGAGIGIMLLIVVLMVGDASIPVTIANTKLIDVCLSFSASLVFFNQAGLVDWRYFVPLAIGSSVGSFLGANWIKKIDVWILRLGLYLVVVASAIKLLITGIINY